MGNKSAIRLLKHAAWGDPDSRNRILGQSGSYKAAVRTYYLVASRRHAIGAGAFDVKMLALHLAAMKGDIELVRFCLAKGAPINARIKFPRYVRRHLASQSLLPHWMRCYDQYRAVDIALVYQRYSTVAFLIGQGAAINRVETCMRILESRQQELMTPTVLRVLLASGDPMLLERCLFGSEHWTNAFRESVFRKIIAAGYRFANDRLASNSTCFWDCKKSTATLVRVAREKQCLSDLFRILLGGLVKARCFRALKGILLAFCKDGPVTAQEAVSMQFLDTTSTDWGHEYYPNVLHMAAATDDTAFLRWVVLILLPLAGSACRDLETQGSDGLTILLRAFQNRCYHSVITLLELGADPNACFPQWEGIRDVSLLRAFLMQNPDTTNVQQAVNWIRLLVRAGANANQQAGDGQTPLEYVRGERHWPPIVYALLTRHPCIEWG